MVKCLDSLELVSQLVKFIILFFTFSGYLKYFTIKRSSFPSHINKKQFPKADNSCFRNTQKMKRDRDDGDAGGGERDKRAGYGKDSPL